MMRTLILGGIFVLLTASHALACSGPHAGEMIAMSETIGLSLWGLTVLIALSGSIALYFCPGKLQRAWWLAGLAAAHPGWWMSARMGDCGGLLRFSSILATTVVVIIALLVIVLPLRRSPAPGNPNFPASS
jgi:hypothetical protein